MEAISREKDVMSGKGVSTQEVVSAHREVYEATGVRLSRSLRYGPASLELLYKKAKSVIRGTATLSELRRDSLLDKLRFLYRGISKLMRTKWYLRRLLASISKEYVRITRDSNSRPPSREAFFALHGVRAPAVPQVALAS